ncbi:hypothetical protein ACFWRV_27530 [Streptomyces sp. NPDC058576]|uniref:hypothetical protein n=1 Tax=Streptomyces sp. NPDC058576 TaxID=3346547 RepID=UPI00365356D5
MNTLTGLIGHVPAPAAYAILAAAVLAESVLLLGAFIPTLTLLLAAGALARTGDLNLVLVIAIAAGAVVAGDALGHRAGHLLGSRLRTGRLGRRIPTAASAAASPPPPGSEPKRSWPDAAVRPSSCPASFPSYAP